MTIPLSHAQRRLWFLNRIDPLLWYNSPLIWRLSGALDVGALRAALGDVVSRHEALRTVFPEEGGEPFQRVLPEADVLELAGPGFTVADAERHVFDLTSQVPLRAWLFPAGAGGQAGAGERAVAEERAGAGERGGSQEWLLVLVLHHIASDGWSLAPLARDLSAAYAARSRGEAPGWEPLPVQYADYTVWQRELLGDEGDPGSVFAGQVGYWREQLAGLPEELALPYDRPRPAVVDHRGGSVPVTVPAQLHAGLAALARRDGATLFMVLHAALAGLLTRLGAGTDVPLGTVVAGRLDEALDDLVGFFVNTLVLRADTSGDPTFRELLGRVRESDLAAYDHQDLPFDAVVEALNPPRSLTRHPLFQTQLTLQNNTPWAVEFDGLAVEHIEPQTVVPRFDLSFLLGEEYGADGSPAGLAGEVVYRGDMFDAETVQALADRLVLLLGAAVAAPDTPVSRLEIMSGAERQRLLREWNDTARPVPPGTLAELFAAQAARTPDAPAVTDATGTLSYAQLDQRANHLAHRLVAAGAGPDVPVAILADRSAELLVSIMGVLKAGACYLPLPAGAPGARLAHIVAHAGAPILITDRDHDLDVACELRPQPGTSPAPPPAAARPDNLAYIIYTSGSTGTPKGVATTHKNVAARALDAIWPKEGRWRSLMHAPHSFGASAAEFWPALLAGGEVVVAPAGQVGLSDLDRLIPRDEQTRVHAAAGLFRVTADGDPDCFRGLGEVVTGGDTVSAIAVRRVLASCPDLAVRALYGSAEISMGATTYLMRHPEEVPDAVPIGSPLDNTGAYVLDERLRPVPPGVPGELCLTGAGLARGYLGRAALTAERFVAAPYGPPGQRMYRTGDIVRWRRDGTLDFVSRSGSQVTICGCRVHPGELEAVLAGHPDVSDAVVVGDDDGLVGYLTPATVDIPGVRARIAAAVPDYLVPRALVALDELPLTPDGRLDRTRLPATAPGSPAAATSPSRPKTAEEEILARLMADVLGLPDMGVSESFFDVGGHSLLAARLQNRIQVVLGRRVSLDAIFTFPTPSALARVLSHGSERAPLRRVGRAGRVPLSYAQRRLWYMSQADELGQQFNMSLALRVSDELDAEVLRAALGDVVSRHEALRTVFPEEGGEPFQRMLPEADVLELAGPGFTVADAEQHRFDLTSQVPLRAWLFPADGGEQLLVLVVHHIASDGWSLAPLARDLSAAYAARSRGEAPGWEPLPVQYADYTVWQRELLGDEGDPGSVFAGQVGYWREQLAGLPQELALPYDRLRPAVVDHRGGIVPVQVPAPLHAGLLDLARRDGATLFMVLHAALAGLLTRLGAGTDVPLGTVVAGRLDEALDDLVGFFVNTLVLRADTSGDPTFRELLGRVRESDLAAYDHQDLPFDAVVEALNPPRSLTRHPLFQTVLTLQNNTEALFELPGITTGAGVQPDGPVGGPMEFELGPVEFDLSFLLGEEYGADGSPAGLAGEVVYRGDMFDAETVQALADRLVLLLGAAVAAPDTPVSRLEIMSGAERQRLLREWNDTARPVPPGTLAELFAAQAARTPDAPAVTDATGTLSYAQLDQRANHLAHRLVAAGAGPDVPVAILADRSAELLVSIMGVLKAGACYLPLPAGAPGARLAHIVAHAGAPILITDRDHDLDVACELRPQPGTSPAPPPAAARPDNLAYIIYTSGSTGTPKGVATTHKNVAVFVLDAMSQAEEDGGGTWRSLMYAPHSFDASAAEFWPALLTGGEVVAAAPGNLDLAALAETIVTEKIDVAQFTPTLFALLADHAPAALAQLFLVTTGGERISASCFQRVADACPDTIVVNGYGPTETTVAATWYMMPPGHRLQGRVPIGRPMSNTSVYLLDRYLQPVPPGTPAELYIGGPRLGRGYVGGPGLTAERFVADPFGPPGQRMYRTGDVARWNRDGTIDFLERSDFQVKIRGHRVEPAEIEVVLESHPGVSRAAVAAREDRMGTNYLVAYLVPRTAPAKDAGEMAAGRLPAYMLPSAYVTLDELPLTAHGKLDRNALPEPARPAVSQDKPESPQEAVVAGLFAEVLGLPAVGRNDSFFDLGGHSLLATQLVKRIGETFRCELGVPLLFEAPTVAALTSWLLEGSGPTGQSLSGLLPLREGTGPPLFCIHPGEGMSWCYAGLLQYLDGSVPVYGIQARGLTGDEDLPSSLEEVAAEYVRHIRAVQSEGPYFLLGWSYGGVVAQAVATRLQADEQEIGLLALLDAYPANQVVARELSRAEIISLAFDGLDVPDSAGLSPADLRPRLAERGSALGDLSEQVLADVLRVTENNIQLLLGFEPDSYDGNALLFQAARDGENDERAKLWQAYITGEIAVHPVDSTHFHMTSPEALSAIGPIVATAIQEYRNR